jgi:hypothetical protein
MEGMKGDIKTHFVIIRYQLTIYLILSLFISFIPVKFNLLFFQYFRQLF